MAQQLLFILGEPNFDSAEVLLVGPAAGGNSFWDTGTCQMLIRSDPDLVTLITLAGFHLIIRWKPPKGGAPCSETVR